MLYKHCSERAKISVCYQHSFGPKEHGIVTAAIKKINSVLARPNTMRKEKWMLSPWETNVRFEKGTECLFIEKVSPTNT